MSKSQSYLDLNKLDWIDGVEQKDYSTKSGNIEAHFKNLEHALLDSIAEAVYVIGCVAWFTLFSLLDALAQKRAVSIIVQKEDWLRIDFDERGLPVGRKAHLRKRITHLPAGNARWFDFDNRLHFADAWEFDDEGKIVGPAAVTVDPIRCVGPYSKAGKSVHPRMHHKFLVFCREPKEGECGWGADRPVAHPYAVWTGSFNLTSNATRSFENAVLIRDEIIADAYMKEWAQLMAFSEPLDWTAEQPVGDMDFSGFWCS